MAASVPTVSGRERGFYLIGLLCVIAIILILTYQRIGPEKAGQARRASREINRAKVAGCTLNRQAFAANLMMWRVNHMDEPLTIEHLRESGVHIPGCPAGGEWSISPDGTTIYCSIHYPDPNAPTLAAKGEPEPTATPEPSPVPTPESVDSPPF